MVIDKLWFDWLWLGVALPAFLDIAYYVYIYIYIYTNLQQGYLWMNCRCLEIFFSPLEDGTQKNGGWKNMLQLYTVSFHAQRLMSHDTLSNYCTNQLLSMWILHSSKFIVDMEIMENPLANHHIYVLLIILIGFKPNSSYS